MGEVEVVPRLTDKENDVGREGYLSCSPLQHKVNHSSKPRLSHILHRGGDTVGEKDQRMQGTAMVGLMPANWRRDLR